MSVQADVKTSKTDYYEQPSDRKAQSQTGHKMSRQTCVRRNQTQINQKLRILREI